MLKRGKIKSILMFRGWSMERRKIVLTIAVLSLAIILVDAYHAGLSFLGFPLNYFGYHGLVYPIVWLVPVIVLAIWQPEKWKLWIAIGLTVWLLNDLLWFLVDPKAWILEWDFINNRWKAVWEITKDFKIYMDSRIMFASGVIRAILAYFFFRSYFKERKSS